MNQGGIAGRLVDLVLAVLGRLPGSLLVANGANALFRGYFRVCVGSRCRGGEHGAGRRRGAGGYDPALCAAPNGAPAPSGLLIPPSNALITYSLAAGGVSVSAFVPGGLCARYSVGRLLYCRGGGGSGGERDTGEPPGNMTGKIWEEPLCGPFPLTLIVVVIGGITAGIHSHRRSSHCRIIRPGPGDLLREYHGPFVLAYRHRQRQDERGMVVFLIGVSNILGWVWPSHRSPRQFPPLFWDLRPVRRPCSLL